MKETFLDKAKTNYRGAQELYKLKVTDEGYINLVSYLLQQSAELGIKYIYDVVGVPYPKTHNIYSLIVNLPKNYKKYAECLEKCSNILTSWNSDARYKKGFRSSVIEVEEAFRSLDQFFSKIDTLGSESMSVRDIASLYVDKDKVNKFLEILPKNIKDEYTIKVYAAVFNSMDIKE